jgi:hypothetical protein
MISNSDVKSWFQDEDYVYDMDLGYVTAGETLHLANAPENVVVKVVEANNDTDYDSYGNGYLVDGYIIFSVTDAEGNSEIYKLPMSYQSYDGWEYSLNEIAPTVKKEKIVTTWEWV